MGLIVCPSRELARQTHEVVMGYIDSLKKDGYPQLRALLAMGGTDMREQVRFCDESALCRGCACCACLMSWLHAPGHVLILLSKTCLDREFE